MKGRKARGKGRSIYPEEVEERQEEPWIVAYRVHRRTTRNGNRGKGGHCKAKAGITPRSERLSERARRFLSDQASR